MDTRQGGILEVNTCKNMHSPTLNTVIMVEETIKELGACTITELYKALPKTVIYPTLKLIINYFYARGFIISDKEGKIVWVYDPKGVKEYLKKQKNLQVKR